MEPQNGNILQYQSNLKFIMNTAEYDLANPLIEDGEVTKDDKQWGMLSHLGTFLGTLIPFANFLVPFIIWQTYKDDSDFVSDHAKESLNFQLSLIIYYIVAGISVLVLIGIALLPLVYALSMIFPIIASIKTYEGKKYQYPFIIRFVK